MGFPVLCPLTKCPTSPTTSKACIREGKKGPCEPVSEVCMPRASYFVGLWLKSHLCEPS